jgi:hypothetical protein
MFMTTKKNKEAVEEPAQQKVSTADIVDAILFVKLKDGRTRQVLLSQDEAVALAKTAAILRPEFKVLDQDQGVNFQRQE